MSKATTIEIIVKDCDNCALKAINCSNRGGITICAIEKSADTFGCNYGLVPEGCPLIKNDIVVKLRKDVEVMEATGE